MQAAGLQPRELTIEEDQASALQRSTCQRLRFLVGTHERRGWMGEMQRSAGARIPTSWSRGFCP